MEVFPVKQDNNRNNNTCQIYIAPIEKKTPKGNLKGIKKIIAKITSETLNPSIYI